MLFQKKQNQKQTFLRKKFRHAFSKKAKPKTNFFKKKV
jgi:hypothetical protein